jgi:hypothetical protein
MVGCLRPSGSQLAVLIATIRETLVVATVQALLRSAIIEPVILNHALHQQVCY